MKIRVIYNDTEIISVDKPDGAAAIDYDKSSLMIDSHDTLLPFFYERGFAVSKISEYLIVNGIEINNIEWMPKPVT